MGGKSKSSRRENKSDAPFVKIIIGAVAASVLYFAFLAVFAVLALNSGMASSNYMPAGMIVGAITGFAGGFISVKPLKEKGALFGLITGALQAVICSCILFVVNEAYAGNGIFILCALVIISAVFGGIAAVNFKIKKKY